MKRRTKSIDGRTTKGLRISAEVQERILQAYLELLHNGYPTPTANEIAKRAKLSVRVIFKHYTHLGLLRSTAIAQIANVSRSFFPQREASPEPTLEGRMRQFIARQTAMFEVIGPYRRAAALVENTDPAVAAMLKQVRAIAIAKIALALGSGLKSLSAARKRELLFALHTVCAWPAWETLRAHHGVSAPKARRIVTRAALAILRDAVGNSDPR